MAKIRIFLQKSPVLELQQNPDQGVIQVSDPSSRSPGTGTVPSHSSPAKPCPGFYYALKPLYMSKGFFYNKNIVAICCSSCFYP